MRRRADCIRRCLLYLQEILVTRSHFSGLCTNLQHDKGRCMMERVPWAIVFRLKWSSVLFYPKQSRSCDFAVLHRGTAANAQRTDDPTIHHNRDAALDRDYARETEDSIAASSNRIGKHLRAALEASGGSSFFARNEFRPILRTIHFLEHNKFSARFHHRESHCEVMGKSGPFGGRDNCLRLIKSHRSAVGYRHLLRRYGGGKGNRAGRSQKHTFDNNLLVKAFPLCNQINCQKFYRNTIVNLVAIALCCLFGRTVQKYLRQHQLLLAKGTSDPVRQQAAFGRR